MDSTPSLTRSPASPPDSHSPSIGHPSPGLVNQHYRLSISERRCSMAPPLDPTSVLPPLEALGQAGWGQNGVLHTPSTAGNMPTIVSSEYDPFAAYDSGPITVSQPYGHEVYGSQHHHLEPATIDPSPRPPARSPAAPPARSPALYPSSTLVPQPLTPPPVKIEASRSEYAQGADYPSPRSIHLTYSAEAGTYSGVPVSGDISETQSSAWSKGYNSAEPESLFTSAIGQPLGLVHERRAHLRAHRPRMRKRLTTKEEANFQCEVKGCGKLFSRSYNFKAHMETHDQNREYPFPCGDCSKKFVRKTDLQRHHQSVHMKERNHKCDFCGRLFARKDTLRRHMEDGCSRRFDIALPPMSIPSIGASSLTDPTGALRSSDLVQSNDQSLDDIVSARFRPGWGNH